MDPKHIEALAVKASETPDAAMAALFAQSALFLAQAYQHEKAAEKLEDQ